MLDKIKCWFAPPVFPDDAEKTRTARILNVIVLANIGVWLLALSVLPFSQSAGIGVVVILPMLVLGGIAFAFLRAGHIYKVGKLFVVFLWLTSTVMIVLTGGVKSPETAAYILIIACAGLLSGLRTMWFFTGLSVVGMVAIYVVEMLGWLPTPVLKTDALGGMMIGIVNPLLVSAVFTLALLNLQRALNDVQASAQTLSTQNQELATIHASLEAQVAARTQTAEAARQEAESAHEVLQEQMWQISGLAQLSEAMATVQDVSALADVVLAYVCDYVDAAVGTVYLMQDAQFVPVAYYAYPAAEHKAAFALGEGLVGQVALERQPHILSASATPLVLVSSFGEIVLAQVALYPVVYVGEVLGVMEIGRVTAFTPAQTQFLTQALERVAASLNVLLAQSQIAQLLQETQQQAEELQVQEEELRAANEELLVKAEALRAQENARAQKACEESIE